MRVLACVALIAALFWLSWFLFPPVRVCGDSMDPTYRDGELLLSTRLFRRSRLKPGDVVVYRQPQDGERLVIKRVERAREGCAFCVGDNAEVSYDSRMYGWVPLGSMVCKPLSQRGRADGEEDTR